MFLPARGTAGLLLCYFKGWLPWEAKCPKQVGQEAGEGLQGGQVGACWDARPHGGMCCAPREGTHLGCWAGGRKSDLSKLEICMHKKDTVLPKLLNESQP